MTGADAGVELPAVDPAVAAVALEALPARLRRRLDAAVQETSGWTTERDGDDVIVRIGEATVRLSPGVDGAVRVPEAAHCDCLLSPRCLHLAAVLSAAPVAAEPVAAEPVAGESMAGESVVAASTAAAPAERSPATDGGSARLDDAEVAVCLGAWRALGPVVVRGCRGCGAVEQADVLRAVTGARVVGLPRLADGLLRVAEGLRRSRADDPAFARDAFAADLREAVLVTARLLATRRADRAVEPALRGSSRRTFAPLEPVALAGLLCEPVATATGYSGVSTLLGDRNGRTWSVGGVLPGTVEDVPARYGAGVGWGGLSVSARGLARAGLLASGATASPDGRLGGGTGVQATVTAASDWTEAPLAQRWDEAWEGQVRRVLSASREPGRVGDDLLYLDASVLGATSDGAVALVADFGAFVGTCSPAAAQLGAGSDLALLARHPGLPLRLVARLDPKAHRTLVLVALGPGPRRDPDQPDPAQPDPAQPDPDQPVPEPPALRLPPGWRGRVNLGLDRLSAALLGGTAEPVQLVPVPASAVREGPASRAQRWAARVAAGGRDPVLAARESVRRDASRARRGAAPHAADLLEELVDAADAGRRRADGSLVRSAETFVRAWARLAVHADGMDRALLARDWTGEPG